MGVSISVYILVNIWMRYINLVEAKLSGKIFNFLTHGVIRNSNLLLSFIMAGTMSPWIKANNVSRL